MCIVFSCPEKLNRCPLTVLYFWLAETYISWYGAGHPALPPGHTRTKKQLSGLPLNEAVSWW